MAQANPFDQFDSQAQPVPVQALQPIVGNVSPEEQSRKAREEERDITRLDVTLQGEQRAASKEQFDRITTYRKEFLTEPTVRQFREVQNSTRQIVDLAGRESDQPGPGDIALIISFMKALDPGSVVRETEFATAENAGGVPETVRNAYNKLISGGRLTPEIKREFASAATSMYNSRLSGYNAFAQDYRGLIEAEGADPDAQGVRLAEAITFGAPPPPGTREADAGEPFLTERDKELQAKLSQAYASGATLAELQALAQQYGQTVPIASQEELDAARAQGRGIVVTPTGMGVPDPREEMGFFEGALETVTGSERSTPEVEALPDWTTMPELNSLSVDSFQAALGTMITNPQESVAIIRAQFPGVQVRQDEKGNFILRSSADGQEYAIKPGFRVSDIPRALGGLAAFTPAGRATTAGGAAISGGLTQAGIEASQAATGGEFNAEEVLLASGGNVLGQQIGRGVNAVRNARAARTATPEVAPVQPAPSPEYVIPPAPSQLNKPRVPTAEEMNRFSKIENVPLSQVRRGQDKFDIAGNKSGQFAEPLVEGYGDIPVAVRLRNGEVIVYDGNHRTALALGQGRDTMRMHVIDAARFDAENAGRVPAPQQSSEDIFAELQAAGFDMEAAANAAPSPPPIAPDELAVPTLTAETQTEVGTIARQAIGRGKNAKDAQAKLAIMAQVDPEARAAAERLGIELPVDVLSNDARLLTVTGLARSQIGSEAQTAWGQTVSQVIQQSDDTLRAIGATRDLGQVSETVRNRLVKDIDNLEADAGVLRREVDDAIDVQGRVDAKSLQAQLTKTINDLGGIDEAKQAFSAEEKKLLAMLGEGEQAKMPTYARLNQVRDQVGRALFKNQGPWVDAPTATLKRYYGALADDQIAHIEAVAGKEIADKMRGSNDLYSQMFKARESMKTVYGKSLEKDIGPLIKTAITTGAKGNGEALRKLMSAVPEDLRPQAILSGIFSLAERQSAQRGFSFAEYAKLYSGLRQNSPIYAEIAKTIGKENEVILRDLYSISKRVAMAENKIVRTGASNQPLLNALNAEGLVSKLAAGAVRRGAVTGGTALAGGVAGGPVGAVVGGGIADALQQSASQAGKSNLDKLHSVLASEPFKDLVEKVADGTVKPADVNRTANDKGFRRFATTVLGIKDFDGRRNWLQSAMTAGASTQATPEQQPTSTIEVR